MHSESRRCSIFCSSSKHGLMVMRYIHYMGGVARALVSVFILKTREAAAAAPPRISAGVP